MGASLIEETLLKILSCKTSRAAFLALDTTFAHSSLSRANQLREELLALCYDSLSFDDYANKFKLLCNQLVAIGRPVEESNKTRWFLHGLGPQFTNFVDTQMAVSPVPLFRDLLHQAKQ